MIKFGFFQLRKLLQKNEIITVGELYKRFTGKTGSFWELDIFYKTKVLNNPQFFIFKEFYPIKVQRRK